MKVINQPLVIECVSSRCDLRTKGSNLHTGLNAYFHVRGRNVGYKVYRTSTELRTSYYIKQKGINCTIYNNNKKVVVYRHSASALVNSTGCYFDKEV